MPRSWINPVPDRRTGDRHKPRTRPRPTVRQKPRTRWEIGNVIAWDGEGANVDGIHVYNLMANSYGRYIHNDRGLSTAKCFDFMLAHVQQSAIHVIFSGGYDVNMILRDLTFTQVLDLWTEGRVHYKAGGKTYRITYKHRKVFTVALQDVTQKSGYTKSFVLWDTFGFYQCSFVKACRKWLVDDERIDAIDDMKQRRSEFTTQDFPTILDYCLRECRMLVMLTQELIKSLDGAGIRLSRFDGAGAIAGAMLRKHKVKEHAHSPKHEWYHLIQMAYFGGRIEAVLIGNYEGDTWKSDINSAYPYAMCWLPSWKDTVWVKENRPNDTALCSLVAVEWSYSREEPFYPLPFRGSDGTILFPRTGAGVYWNVEFEAMAARFEEGVDYEILYAVNVYRSEPEFPLTWIQDAYDTRLEMKRRGDMAQETIKLGINSIYGKFAQQEGYVSEIKGVRHERFPSNHCLAWASLATAITRARMYTTAIADPNTVIAFATDAIISTRPCDVDCGDGLGQWTVETYSGCTIVQAGVYWLREPDTGEWKSKYRGFDPESLHRGAVLEAWMGGHKCTKDGHEGQSHLPVTLTRFVGMGSALPRKDFRKWWRTWQAEPRCLDLLPQGKRIPLETGYADHLCETMAATNLSPGQSAPYPVIWVDGVKGTPRPTEDGVDLRTLENEYEESYL